MIKFVLVFPYLPLPVLVSLSSVSRHSFTCETPDVKYYHDKQSQNKSSEYLLRILLHFLLWSYDNLQEFTSSLSIQCVLESFENIHSNSLCR